MEEDKIIIETKEDTKEFYKLATFYSNKTNKRYLLYTDKEYTDGLLNIYGSIIEQENDKVIFIELDEEDKKIVEKAISKLRESIKSN
ncbi:MAG: hypothetical protein IKE90_03545 [Bacilli bacterium]|nr:hypothetical protein [Bacilli bacterium]